MTFFCIIYIQCRYHFLYKHGCHITYIMCDTASNAGSSGSPEDLMSPLPPLVTSGGGNVVGAPAQQLPVVQ